MSFGRIQLNGYGQIHGSPIPMGAIDTLPRYNRPLGSLGALGDSSSSEESSDFTSLLQTYAPAITTITNQVLDPRRQVEVLRAELANARARGAPASKIRKIEARLRAAEAKVADQQAQTQDVATWRKGVTRNLWIATGIGVAAIVSIGVGTYVTARRGRR